jgi:DNA adenine methylase
MFGGTLENAFRFKTQVQFRELVARWPMTVLYTVESVPPREERALAPFVKWAGGKRQLLPELRKSLPGTFRHYYEPFVGGGALFFDLRASGFHGTATLGDANERLVRTYIGVRDDVSQVIHLLQGFKYDKRMYLRERARRIDTADDAEVAAWLIYLNRTGFNGLYRVNQKGEFNVPFGRYENPTICDEELLLLCSKALRKTKIVAWDFVKTVKGAEAGDLVYFDPPYVPVSDTSDFTSYTKDKFGPEDQERLRDCAWRLKKLGVHVVLSSPDVPIIRKLYKRDFKIRRVEARRNINSKVAGRGIVGEVIVT